MDILSHTFSGVAAVSVALPFTSFDRKQKFGTIILGAFVGAFPDLDAISLYSKFGETGKSIYFGKQWFSHHAFNHSLVAGILLASVILFFRSNFFKSITKSEVILFLGLFAGFFAHLLEDMPTPFGVWGGVRLFFPSSIYIGGSGKIWWWNNYDLFLLILSISLVNFAFQLTLKKHAKVLTVLSSVAIVLLIIFQIETRVFDYNSQDQNISYYTLEKQSKEEQKRILGKKIYSLMESFDNKLPFYF